MSFFKKISWQTEKTFFSQLLRAIFKSPPFLIMFANDQLVWQMRCSRVREAVEEVEVEAQCTTRSGTMAVLLLRMRRRLWKGAGEAVVSKNNSPSVITFACEYRSNIFYNWVTISELKTFINSQSNG